MKKKIVKNNKVEKTSSAKISPKITSVKKTSHKKKINIGSIKTVNTDKLFPIVVIGASAGGLEAYTKLLKNLSSDTGMAYVIIQHLSPDYKSMLTEILQRETPHEVLTIRNGMKPQPDKIYVTPPTYSILMKGGIFHLNPRSKDRRPFMPIDVFMTSIAEDKRHFVIGVIMSGTDHDGVIGMECIKASGGITYAQDSKSSKFFDMPRNSINAGVVDFVLSPKTIADELNKISTNRYLKVKRYVDHDDILTESGDQISKVLNILKTRKNIDFKLYKPTTVRRRILRRMLMNKIDHIKDYVKFLHNNIEEIEELCQDILINVTSFFRDPEMYVSLKANVFPKLIKNRKSGDSIRIWVTACSTGEEAYSMAIALVEFLGNKSHQYKIQIFSTDLNNAGIEKARNGIYTGNIKTDVSEDRLKKFFVKHEGKYRINKYIRNLCVFAKQNLIQDPPFSSVDLISCRNVLIYLGSFLQNKVLSLFHYALKPSGFLILGSSETVGTYKDLFELVDRKNRIHSKKPQKNITYKYEFNELNSANKKYRSLNSRPLRNQNLPEFQKEAESLILNKYSPPSIIINQDLEIVLVRGDISKYLETPQGLSTHNILKMIKYGLSTVLGNLISQSIKRNRPIRKNKMSLTGVDFAININIVVEPFTHSDTKQKLFLIIFEDNSKPIQPEGIVIGHKTISKEKLSTHSKQLAIVNKELADSKQDLKTEVEDHQTTNDELSTANEEIQSSNEELQSTNEELETTKEELQSTNEELITVNEEIQERNLELGNVNNDLTNLLNSIRISIIIVDNDLKIKRYTNEASRLLNILPVDIGRKITDINTNLEINSLKTIIKDVLKSLQVKEIEVKDNKNCWYSMHIRPYKTHENKIEGVLITFIDISDIKIAMLEQDSQKRNVEKLNVELGERMGELKLEVIERAKVENSLRILSQSLIEAQENERLKLSRELHDNVNQVLSLAKLKAHTAEIRIGEVINGKPILKYMTDTKKFIEKAIEEIRRLSHSLRPSALADIGITATICSLADEFTERTNIKVTMKEEKIPKGFSEEIELTLYRIVQEGLNNIERHSNATNVKISLNHNGKEIQLTISDNGKGFVPKNYISKNHAFQHLGLMGIKERADSVDGKVMIKTERGLGTLIEVVIPFNFKKHIEQTQKNKNNASRRSSISANRNKSRAKKK